MLMKNSVLVVKKFLLTIEQLAICILVGDSSLVVEGCFGGLGL
jgi:hypothetical protein